VLLEGKLEYTAISNTNLKLEVTVSGQSGGLKLYSYDADGLGWYDVIETGTWINPGCGSILPGDVAGLYTHDFYAIGLKPGNYTVVFTFFDGTEKLTQVELTVIVPAAGNQLDGVLILGLPLLLLLLLLFFILLKRKRKKVSPQ